MNNLGVRMTSFARRATAGVSLAALLTGSVAIAATAATEPPPYNQDGLEADFTVNCFFLTDYQGNPIPVPDDPNDLSQGYHPADPSDADDVAWLKANVPAFYQSAMNAIDQNTSVDVDYPFAVDVHVEVGTGDNKLPENPMPGETYAGPFDSDLDLVLPEPVAYVLSYNGQTGLKGTVTANAELQMSTDTGPASVGLTSDPFELSSARTMSFPFPGSLGSPTLNRWR